MTRNRSHLAWTVLGVLLLGWVAAQLAFLGNFSSLDAAFVLVAAALIASGQFFRQRRRIGANDQLHRMQQAMHDIATSLDPLAEPATSQQPPLADEAHAPGKAHRH